MFRTTVLVLRGGLKAGFAFDENFVGNNSNYFNYFKNFVISKITSLKTTLLLRYFLWVV